MREREWFQSSPGPEAERYKLRTAPALSARSFQSSPGPEAERYLPGGDAMIRVTVVSILARPGGRAYRPSSPPIATWPSFNPRPARRPSDTSKPATATAVVASFQSSPGPEAERYRRRYRRGVAHGGVSILARPGGRALLPTRLADDGQPAQFQSSPGPEAERYRRRRRQQPNRHCFNPRPARRPSATRELLQDAEGPNHVSILARPGGRGATACRSAGMEGVSGLNPRPARRPSARPP